jgi:hypothetical protein
MHSKLPFDNSLARNILFGQKHFSRSNMDVSDETSERVYEYVNKVKVQRLFGQGVQKVIFEIAVCMADGTSEDYKSGSIRRRL